MLGQNCCLAGVQAANWKSFPDNLLYAKALNFVLVINSQSLGHFPKCPALCWPYADTLVHWHFGNLLPLGSRRRRRLAVCVLISKQTNKYGNYGTQHNENVTQQQWPFSSSRSSSCSTASAPQQIFCFVYRIFSDFAYILVTFGPSNSYNNSNGSTAAQLKQFVENWDSYNAHLRSISIFATLWLIDGPRPQSAGPIWAMLTWPCYVEILLILHKLFASFGIAHNLFRSFQRAQRYLFCFAVCFGVWLFYWFSVAHFPFPICLISFFFLIVYVLLLLN